MSKKKKLIAAIFLFPWSAVIVPCVHFIYHALGSCPI